MRASAGWEIDIFGRLTSAKRGAREALEASRAYRQAVQTRLVATVATEYYTLLMLDEQLRISRETLDSWKETVRTLRALKRGGGGITEAAVLQAEANCLSLESGVLAVQKSIRETENILCTLLAQTPTDIPRGEMQSQTFPKELSVGIPLQLLSHRPDVRVAEHQLAAACYATNSARAAFYPSINLSGTAGWTNDGGGVELNPARWLTNAIGSLVQPLFNRGTNIANLKVAKAEQEAAILAFRQTLLEAGAEVNDALTAVQTARQQVNQLQVMSHKLQEAVRKTELLMRHSSANYLEVLTAQQSLLTAQQALLQARFDEIHGTISLYHALGGGYER